MGYLTDVPTTWNQYRTQAYISGIPVIGNFYRVRDEMNYLRDYYRNQPYVGFPRYPSQNRLWSAYSGYTSESLNFVSSNLKRFYD